MWRYFASGVALMLFALAGFLFTRTSAAPPLPPQPSVTGGLGADAELPEEAPRASDRTREQKRFDRYDKDRNDAITREEYLVSRRKAFAKLDSNGDGRLSFDEWAAKTIDKFGTADADRSGSLTRAEFATTAPKRRAPARKCKCPPQIVEAQESED